MSSNSKWGVFWLLVIGIVAGVVLTASMVSVVQWAGSDKFCSTFCHSMTSSAYAWKQGLHARTPTGVTAGCSDCHLTNETNHPLTPVAYVELLLAKVKAGTSSLIGEIKGNYSTTEKWLERRPVTEKHALDLMISNNFKNCRGCHNLEDMYNAKKPMIAQFHKGFIDKPTNCVQCHKTAGHNYKEVDAYIAENHKFPALEDAWKQPQAAAK